MAIKLPIPDSIRRNVDQGLNFLGRQRDLMLVVLLISVVALIAAPLPAIILDVLIIINFALSIVVILTAVSIESPLALSSLPSLLLFTTLLRLALNIASTKMILLTGHGPRVVETFGTLVVGGNYVVGAIVFLILSVVQFIVIAKGSERAAEVAARFTLDAMPGKQMAIDADLRAGLITMNEARERRQEIERESKLHGGMDGAMKFVKGDAIAGLVIAAITILGGIGVGVGMKDMSMGEAASRYAVLTIGDSMVAQIPSLLLSVAAGVLITQSGGGNGDGHAGSVASVIAHQISGHPRALLLSGSLLLMSAAVPGFPSLPLIIVAVMLLAPGSVVLRRKAQRLWTASAPVAGFAREGRSKAPPMISSAPNLTANPLTIRLAPNVSRQLTPEQMNVHFMRMRGELSAQLGMPFPGVQMFEATELERGVIEILMYDVRRFSTTVPARRVLIGFNRQVAPPPEPEPELPSLADLDSDWRWMDPLPPDTPLPAGAFYVRFEALIARAVRLVVFRHAGTLVGMSEATTLLRAAENEYPELVAEVQKVLTLNKIADVLRRLLDEMMPVRDMRNILETLSIAAAREKDPVMLTEQVRIAMTSQTCQRFSPGGGIVYVVVLSEDAEAAVRSALQESRGNYLPFTVDESKRLVASCRKAAEGSGQRDLVLAVHVEIRRYLRKIVEPQARELWVVSFGELADASEVVVLGEADFRE